jgi:primosomal protein N' (replication factor Y)
MGLYYQVAVNFPKSDSVLTYHTEDKFDVGDLVEVPLGKRKAKGTILGVTPSEKVSEINASKIKNIEGKLENSFQLTQKEIELYSWMSKYYHYSLGKLIFDCLPKILKRPRQPKFLEGRGEDLPFDLNKDQAYIFGDIKPRITEGFSQNYIHGVTGSGKSAIYLSLMKQVLNSGKSVQFLLPEINLTPQFTQMFETFLKCKVLVFHSGVTPSDKYNIWQALNESDDPVLIMGVRSSIFLPIQKLGLIIVDEEHDQSFKQTDRCTYNGRDVAIKKAQLHQCPFVMGSATPSLENFYQFENEENHRHYYTIKERASSGEFPDLQMLDTRERFKEKDKTWPFLDETLGAIQDRLDAGEQVLIFINKLGFSSYIQCRSCGHQFYNDNCGCQNNLRFFKKKNLLSCAHCEFKMPLPSECPECGGITIMNKGFGTEKVEQVLSEIYPDKKIERFDRDEIKTTKDLNDKLDRFHKGEIDVFVGTQMLAKGHNFKKVNLVVILGIDSMLNYADFRSSEKTYQLIEQVAGRAGRFAAKSKVIIQTMNPEHSVFKFIQAHSFSGFYREEIPLRQLCYCPPFTKIVMLYFSSRFRDRLITEVTKVSANLTKVCSEHFPEVRLYGPTPLSIEKKANQFTWAIMFKSDKVADLHKLISTFEFNYKPVSNISHKIDVDPIHLL